MNRCEAAHARLSDLASGELSDVLAAETRAHVDGCERCDRELAEHRATLRLLARASAELPPDFEAALHRKLVAAGAPAPRHRLVFLFEWLRAPRLPYALAAGLAAALLVALLARPRAPVHCAGWSGP